MSLKSDNFLHLLPETQQITQMQGKDSLRADNARSLRSVPHSR